MITGDELKQIQEQASPSDIPRLISEIERLKRYVIDYGITVSQKVDTIEENMQQLSAENTRLLMAKSVMGVERDACVGLLTQMALALGWKSGIGPQNTAVVELPSGQVSWTFQENESHLFSHLGAYSETVEDLEITEKYRRVMNPDISAVAQRAQTDH